MIDRIRALADERFNESVRIRRALHRRPELAFEEHATAALITAELRSLGLEPKTGIAKTGVVAHIVGAAPGPTVALRADIDALPIQEARDFEFKSEIDGKMHACGHDVHAASLLSVAAILRSIRSELRGTVRLIFQPSEERSPGGAKVMIEEGVLGEIDGAAAPGEILGQHVMPAMPVGTLGVRGGSFMASADELFLTIRGKGGHAASPHELVDPVLVQAHILVALQSVISRNRPPGIASLLSFGKVVAEGATNVIPDDVQLIGTFRSMDEDWRYQAHALIRRTAEHTAQAFGATCEVRIDVGYPCLVNSEETASFVRDAAIDFVGAENVIDLPEWYASEDFAFYTREIPGAFYILGVGNEAAGYTHGLHTPLFAVDEEALRLGPAFMAYLTWLRLGTKKATPD